MTAETVQAGDGGPETLRRPGANVRAPEGGWTAESAHAWVADLIARSHSSFQWAMRLLPARKRRAIHAVYAYCRTVDDLADGPGTVLDKQAALAAWRDEINALYDGRPTDPVTVALAEPVAEFGLHREDFLAVIEAMQMDAGERMCAPSLLDLELYCRRAAGAVGMLSASVFGLPRPEGRALALSLGQALQYTNFLRDLVEDAGQGRLYVPREMLETRGIEERDPMKVLAHPAFPGVCEDLAEMAGQRFAAARRVLKACPRGPSRPARIMLAIYRDLLARIEARGFATGDLGKRMRVPKRVRLALALRELLR